jgi:hypothetical protein
MEYFRPRIGPTERVKMGQLVVLLDISDCYVQLVGIVISNGPLRNPHRLKSMVSWPKCDQVKKEFVRCCVRERRDEERKVSRYQPKQSLKHTSSCAVGEYVLSDSQT